MTTIILKMWYNVFINIIIIKKYMRGKSIIKQPIIIDALKKAFEIGCNISEACLYAGIDRRVYYDNKKKYPDEFEKMEALKDKPILRARQTVVTAIGSDPDLAFKYLERKRRDEFGIKETHVIENFENQLSETELLKIAQKVAQLDPEEIQNVVNLSVENNDEKQSKIEVGGEDEK